MSLVVASARPEDAEPLAHLLSEMERYYGATDHPPLAEWAEQVAAILFRPEPPAHVLLVWDDERLVGMASYSYLWPATGVGHSFYMKDLYIREGARKRGAGRMLMTELSRIAAEQGCSRIEWTADTDNSAALNFYAALGARPNPTKQSYRVTLAADGRPPWVPPE